MIPEQDEALVRYDAGSRENLFERMKALKALSSGEDCVVIAPVSAVLKKVALHRTLTERKIKAQSAIRLSF